MNSTPDNATSNDSRRSTGTPPPVADRRRLVRRITLTAVVAAALYAAAAAWADISQVRDVLVSFPWVWLPAILALTLVNYGLRALRWAWYLRLVGAEVGRADAIRIFVAGLPLNLTPGKAGELLKSYMVRNISGTPMATTMPAVIVERLVDGLAMLVLAGAGLFAIDDERLRLSAALALAALIAMVVVVQTRPIAERLLVLAGRLPVLSRFAGSLRSFYESSYVLLRPAPLAIAVLIGVVSWAGEGVAFALILAGVGAPLNLETILFGIFAFSIATVVGALVATPGGVGGVEGVLIALSIQTLDMERGAAVGAALLARVVTLWFGVGIGLVGLARWWRFLEPGSGRTGRPIEKASGR